MYLKRIITYSTLTTTSNTTPILSIEERNLLSISYKNITGSLRTSLRLIETLEKREGAAKQELALLKRQKDKVEKELSAKCKDLLENVLEKLVPAAGKGEERVFYFKMCVPPPASRLPLIVHHTHQLYPNALYSGKATTIATSPNSLNATTPSENTTPRSRSHPTQPPTNTHCTPSTHGTQRVSVSRSILRCILGTSSRIRSGHVIWRSLRSMRRSRA